MALNVKFLKGSSSGYNALVSAGTVNADTFYLTTDDSNLYLGGVKLSNGADLEAAMKKITTNEDDIADIFAELAKLTGDGDESIAKMIETALGDLPTKVSTLIGDDANKSVRTIANEELAKQLIAEGAKESLDTLQEIAAWIQKHPDDAAAMNTAIENLEALVGTLPEGVTATTIAGYVAEAVAAEKTRAEAAEKTLGDRVKAVEEAVGEGGGVADQIKTSIEALDASVKSTDVEAGKGIQVQVDEVDGKITNVTVTGNYSEAYDAKGAAATAESNAKAEAAAKASAAETAAKTYADGLDAAMNTRMETVEANSTKAVKEVVAGTENGTIKVDGVNIAVTGLGTMAYADTANFEASGSAATAESNAKAYVDEALTWGTF